ncbi:TIGR01244 family sulfur transferase [Aurantiacibacter sp. MUD11]|uniref:bifunctional protein tyrosine phosphatase family protein/NAD(P)/FAD-dependent oxidoreductase n=1 Tax=Aurantiacibacter sp. MUD11 TaxID=3003265 RepID=UPI0022AB3ECF|nr:bifunctional protein tyrosine phosphatase family protein/NAD(P)/FAD-dependent oxidoreductase [Aurantiacibacter sp. MUD11]WAT16691.1 TIGR01244 family sulfur transferase [Aurantiacibacter sp. MUD11]
MDITRIDEAISVTGQVLPKEVQALADAGFRTIICNRPDGEDPGQPDFASVAAAAQACGLEVRHIPVDDAHPIDMQKGDFARAMHDLPGPVLAYCRTGNRSGKIYQASRSIAAQAGKERTMTTEKSHHQIVIAGGGSAGIATAASLLAREPDLDIAIIEPREVHYYQPGWTMVGGGVFPKEATYRPEAVVMPDGVTWLKAEVTGFDPDNKAVLYGDGGKVTYDLLIVALGNRLAWEKIEGLEETLGKNGVTSNYRYDLAPYTWELVHHLDKGRAIFTQPPMPIKCAGAPQKAMYLSCSEWEHRGVLPDIEVEFHNQGAVLFGVADYVPALMQYVERYGANLNFGSNLVRIDGPTRKAWFATDQGEVEREFDMIHVVPPQEGNAVVAASPLANEAGYAEVDQHTLRHTRYPDVFALGDCSSTPNAKTMAAARKQAPVVAVNALNVLEGKEPNVSYDGYGSCPLTVERGKIVLAEFGYGGKLLPSFPSWVIDGTKPSKAAWHLKANVLPSVYWHFMLKGREWLAKPLGMAI